MLRGLHKLCDKGQWEDVLAALRDDGSDGIAVRDAASKTGGWGEWTPLHLACKHEPPAAVVSELLRAAPVAAETFDLYNRLPIHYVSEHGTSIETLEALVKSCPESVAGVDSEARTPLHLSLLYANRAYSGGDSVRPVPKSREVAIMLDKEGAVVWTADEAGFLPIHYTAALVDECEKQTFEVLAKADVRTLLAQNDEGLNPLQMALLQCSEKRVEIDIIRLLLGKDCPEVYEEIGKMVDRAGRTALHCACQNFELIPVEVMKEIIESNPSATFVQAPDFGYPIQVLESLRDGITSAKEKHDLLVISDMLFAMNPDIEPYNKDIERLRRFSEKITTEMIIANRLSEGSHNVWVWLCCIPEEQDEDNVYYNIVSDILDKINDDGVRRLLVSVETTTLNGTRRPLFECASSRRRHLLLQHLRFVDRFEFRYDNLLAGMTKSSLSLRAFDYYNKTPRAVVITFMSDPDAFSRESTLREKVQADVSDTKAPAVVPMIDYYDTTRVGTNKSNPGDFKFARDLPNLEKEEKMPYSVTSFAYAMVTEAPTNDFKSLIPSKDEPIKMGKKSLKTYTKQIGEALRTAHAGGVVHADIKIANLVQLANGMVTTKNLASALVLDEGRSRRPEYHGRTASLHTGSVPPEMIAQLSSVGVKRYETYWKDVADDAAIAKAICDDDMREVTERTQKMLGGRSISGYWKRISEHAMLWEKIRPRKVGDDYFVVKCFEGARGSMTPVSPEDLPYELVPADRHHDIWSFGVMLYELVAGIPLFAVNSSLDMCEDNDFRTLFEARSSEDALTDRLAIVEDPIARDLLRQIFGKRDSPIDMEEVLEHPFFCTDMSKSRRSRRHSGAVMKREKELVEQNKAEQEERKLEKQRQAWLDQRSSKIAMSSLELALKFDRSAWSQWRKLDVKQEPTFPVAAILLPYKLQRSDRSNRLVVAASDDAVAVHLGCCLADMLHFTQLAGILGRGQVRSSTSDRSAVTKFFGPSSSLKPAETHLVDMCEAIVKRVESAEQILTTTLASYIPDEEASSNAKKLIHDAIDGLVDVDACRDVLEKAASVEQALQPVLECVGDNNQEMSRNVAAEQLEKFIAGDGKVEREDRLRRLESSLVQLVKAFVENPRVAARDIVEESFKSLASLYKSSKTSYLYLVDESTGSPVQSSKYPKAVEPTSDTLNMMISCMHLVLKSTCASSVPLGLVTTLGLPIRSIPKDWATMKHYRVGGFTEQEIGREYHVLLDVMLEVMGAASSGGSSLLSLFDRFQTFLLKLDEEREFGGLRRLQSLDDKFMWSSSIDTRTTANKAADDLERFAAQEVSRQADELSDLVSVDTKPTAKGVIDLWCSEGPTKVRPQIMNKVEANLDHERTNPVATETVTQPVQEPQTVPAPVPKIIVPAAKNTGKVYEAPEEMETLEVTKPDVVESVPATREAPVSRAATTPVEVSVKDAPAASDVPVATEPVPVEAVSNPNEESVEKTTPEEKSTETKAPEEREDAEEPKVTDESVPRELPVRGPSSNMIWNPPKPTFETSPGQKYPRVRSPSPLPNIRSRSPVPTQPRAKDDSMSSMRSASPGPMRRPMTLSQARKQGGSAFSMRSPSPVRLFGVGNKGSNEPVKPVAARGVQKPSGGMPGSKEDVTNQENKPEMDVNVSAEASTSTGKQHLFKRFRSGGKGAANSATGPNGTKDPRWEI